MEKIAIGFVGLFILVIFGMLGDMILAKNVKEDVLVLEKVYKPASSGVGVATGINPSNGQMVTSTVTTYESEDYKLIVETSSGEVFSTSVSAREYANAKEGQSMAITVFYGGLSGWRY